jgi:hypothetical protein
MPGLTGHRFFSQMKHLIAAFLVAFVQGTSHADVIGGQVVGVTDGDTITLLDPLVVALRVPESCLNVLV